MAIKLIVFDVDGTIVANDHYTVPEKNIAALRRARARGVKLAIASGRAWSILTEVAGQIGGVDYAITSNGASVREVGEDKILYEKGIPEKEALALMDLLDARDLPYEVYCGGKNYVAEKMRDRLGEGLLSPTFAEMYKRHVTFAPDLHAVLGGGALEKINLFYAPSEVREGLREAVGQICPMEISNALEGNMEFTYGGVCKGVALAFLAKELGLTADEVMAFGDAGNDVEMLQWAGWSFAMENGAKVAKAAARYLAPSNEEGGVGQIVERYVLDLEGR